MLAAWLPLPSSGIVRVPGYLHCTPVQKIHRLPPHLGQGHGVYNFMTHISGINTWLAVQFLDYVLPFYTSITCLLYTSPSPRDATLSRMPSSAWPTPGSLNNCEESAALLWHLHLNGQDCSTLLRKGCWTTGHVAQTYSMGHWRTHPLFIKNRGGLTSDFTSMW